MVKSFVRQALNRVVGWVGTAVVRPPAFTQQVVGPAGPDYVPRPPCNAAELSPAFRALFNEAVASPAKVVYTLPRAAVSWHGVVLRGLQVFVPSLPYHESAAEFTGAYGLRQWVGNPVVRLSGRFGLVHDYWSVNNYYHWLADALPRLLLLRETSPNCALLLPAAAPEYLLTTARALGFSRFQFVEKLAFARGMDLVMPGHTAPVGRQDQALLLEVRRRLLAALAPQPPVAASRRVYASRSRQKTRRLLNEEELLPLLLANGFEVVYFEEYTLEQQIQLMQATSIFVGLHGANMTNLLFLPEHAQVVELMDAENPNLCYFNMCANLGIDYRVIPCAPLHAAQVHRNNYDVTVEVSHLKDFLVKEAR
ncbi:glycosyltransferase family 61 protein [Hymenobacter aerilatus]|uniref:Glycosyltransferase family 61 protein n=1 Tax=Hymenobacter aerilatus TaxID=2932251 RepID=A0A8T9SPG9_9BACT|nr:glycosyltransferase family 61 protein [Hymenobacter aerilatus]UOR03942.1 glycosyltransferase family 61 protein [Hymenobacter aerilatus]